MPCKGCTPHPIRSSPESLALGIRTLAELDFVPAVTVVNARLLSATYGSIDGRDAGLKKALTHLYYRTGPASFLTSEVISGASVPWGAGMSIPAAGNITTKPYDVLLVPTRQVAGSVPPARVLTLFPTTVGSSASTAASLAFQQHSLPGVSYPGQANGINGMHIYALSIQISPAANSRTSSAAGVTIGGVAYGTVNIDSSPKGFIRLVIDWSSQNGRSLQTTIQAEVFADSLSDTCTINVLPCVPVRSTIATPTGTTNSTSSVPSYVPAWVSTYPQSTDALGTNMPRAVKAAPWREQQIAITASYYGSFTDGVTQAGTADGGNQLVDNPFVIRARAITAYDIDNQIRMITQACPDANPCDDDVDAKGYHATSQAMTSPSSASPPSGSPVSGGSAPI